MKKIIIKFIIFMVIFLSSFYAFLPVINISSPGFWTYAWFLLFVVILLNLHITKLEDIKFLNKKNIKTKIFSLGTPVIILFGTMIIMIVINIFNSPLLNAKSYANRITVDESRDFNNDFSEVDFNSIPLLDRDSSEKLGDRTMGQMSDLVSQYYVSVQYTQINYNNDILRVTPLEYADFIKWISNRKDGVPGYITVNSVNGESKLTRLSNGMKYTPGAYFNDNLQRKLRFKYPTTIFGTEKFEIDNEGNPYWIIPTISYTGIGLKTKITGAIIFDPITGESTKYKLEDIPEWVDNVYYANLVIEQVDDWGIYRGGFLNSIFGQKNVVNTTDGYNYLALDDDIYLYTGITSVLSDESNLGFILSNLRTGKTTLYSVAGAEEYSAMSSAEGQVQQMDYESTFPLLIKLNGKPTYLVSLKDAAGLVKMYGFVDVEDYQKVTVTDASKGIKVAAQNYLNEYAEEVTDDILKKEEITIKEKYDTVINGTTYYFIVDTDNQKYKVSIELSDNLPFVTKGSKLQIGYYEPKEEIIEIIKVY